MKYSVLIADDEPHALTYLAHLVENSKDLVLKDKCKSGNEVLKFCKTMVPDILLIDIQMPGLNGIETAKRLMQAKEQPLIIFTTAFDQYAIDAFKVEAVEYLLKPFDQSDFEMAIRKAKNRLETRKKAELNKRIENLYQRLADRNSPHLQNIQIKEKGLIKTIKVSDIYYVASDSEYVVIHTALAKHLYRISLELLSKQMDDSFIRIHRSYLISKMHLANWKYLNNGTYEFKMSDGTALTSSRSYQSAIQEWLVVE